MYRISIYFSVYLQHNLPNAHSLFSKTIASVLVSIF